MKDLPDSKFPDRFFEEAARGKIGTGRDNLIGMMTKGKTLNKNVTREMIDHLYESEQAVLDKLNATSDKPIQNKSIKRMMQTLGLKTDQTQARKADVMKPGEVTPSNQLMTTPYLHRQMINQLVGKDPQEQTKLIKSWNESSEKARDAMADLSVEDPESLKDNPFAEYDKKGKYNRNGTYANHFFNNLYEAGLINFDDVKQFATPANYKSMIKILNKVTGKSEKELLGEELTKPSGRDRIERLKKSLRDVQVF